MNMLELFSGSAEVSKIFYEPKRGSKAGTQGLDCSYERSKVPANLVKEIIRNIK